MFGHQQSSHFGAHHLGFDAERRRGWVAAVLDVPSRHVPLHTLRVLGEGDPR